MEANIRTVELRPITCSIEPDGSIIQNVKVCFSDYVSMRRVRLSEAWVASNLLLFTVFDGYLENECRLTEGASFKNHYDNLPHGNNIELIQRDCYRVMKLLRNAMQHNLSRVDRDDSGYEINYLYNGTTFRLKISHVGMAYLYTIIVNLIRKRILGFYKGYNTRGHFEGLMCTYYDKLCSEIGWLEDDIGARNAESITGKRLDCFVRYPVTNPKSFTRPGKIIFQHIYNRAGVNSAGETLFYRSDYTYNDYLLPEEIGIIKSDPEFGCDVIEFDQTVLSELWKKS